MLEVDQVLECKQLHARGVSIREISSQLEIARNTVRRYVRGEAVPGHYRQQGRRARPVTDSVEGVVKDLLEAERSKETPRKQRLTAARIYRLLHQSGQDVGESTVRRLVRRLRLDLRDPLEHAYVPLEFDPGVDAQVDFFEGVADRPDGRRETVFLLLVRACYSGRTFAYAAPNQTRESLFEGLVQAFDHFGGVFSKLWFDNLTPAVKKVLRGRTRELQRSFANFQAHYGFEAEFCTPAKGNEKGGVENEVKYCRHELLSPIPVLRDRVELQSHCDSWMHAEDKRRRRGRERTIGERWSEETERLLRIPEARFEIGEVRIAHVTPRSWVSIATNCYSVPVEWVGREVSARLGAEEITLSSRSGDRVVRHERLYGRGALSLDLDHYLPLLRRKHRALDRAAPLRHWIRKHDRCWPELLRALRRRLGDIDGGKAFIDVLGLAQVEGVERVTEAVRGALRHPDVSVASVYFHLEGEQALVAVESSISNYVGPRSTTRALADYMALMGSEEVLHG